MPDLSFYPESYLVEAARSNPVRFGQLHKQAIGALIDLADVSLSPLAAARLGIARALESDDPWQRYWGLIVCSCFGQAAEEFVPQAQSLSATDPNLLVRTRAAEFLGLIGAADPRGPIMAALAESQSGVEAALILNTVALLRDGQPAYDLVLSPQSLRESVRAADNVRLRLAYLQASEDPGPRAKSRKGAKNDH